MSAKDIDNDEVVMEPEGDEGTGTSAQKLKKLREERDQARQEAGEYLTGWQRTKADYVNLAKRMRENGAQGTDQGIIKLARSVVSVFDSLEAALKAAQDAPESVQKGMAQVATQLESALKEHGVVRYTPETGDLFDPEKHEPMQTLETSVEKEDNTVADVFQSGYMKGETVIRPARVTVKKFNSN